MARRAGPSASARLLAVLLGLVAFGVAGAMTHAAPGDASAPGSAPGTAQSSSGAQLPLAWDWQRGRAEAGPRADRMAVVRAVERQGLGRGRWICSPAGSGMTSQCAAR